MRATQGMVESLRSSSLPAPLAPLRLPGAKRRHPQKLLSSLKVGALSRFGELSCGQRHPGRKREGGGGGERARREKRGESPPPSSGLCRSLCCLAALLPLEFLGLFFFPPPSSASLSSRARTHARTLGAWVSSRPQRAGRFDLN